MEGQLALPGAFFLAKHVTSLLLYLLKRQDQSMFRKQELVRAVERKTVLTLSRELSLNLILLLFVLAPFTDKDILILLLKNVFSITRIVSKYVFSQVNG